MPQQGKFTDGTGTGCDAIHLGFVEKRTRRRASCGGIHPNPAAFIQKRQRQRSIHKARGYRCRDRS